jgi:hypothetical protein
MINYCENIAIIASLTYCDSGVYTKDERFEQVKNTIKSVKEKVPNSFIVFIDISNFNMNEKNYLENNCDLFINPFDNIELINKVSNKKSYGEKSYIQFALDVLNNNTNTYNFENYPNLKNIFKVGARYFLNDQFDYNKYDNSFNIIKIFPQEIYMNACSSCCFKISKQNVGSFVESLKMYDYDLSTEQYDMEKMLYKHVTRLPEINKDIDIIGMTGLSSLNRELTYA